MTFLVKDVEKRPGTWPKLIYKNFKQVSMTWHKSCVAHKFFVECFWRKMSESVTREVDAVSQITASIFWMPTWDYSFQAGNIFKLAQLNRKETWTAGECSWVSLLILGASSWRDRTQIALDWSRGGDSKTHQRLAATMKSGIQVILCQFWSSSLFWKQWYLKNLTVLWKLSAETNTVVAVLLTLLWCRLFLKF